MKNEFYFSKGKIRSECKKCTIKRNLAYQKKAQSWKKRCSNYSDHREYMLNYYADNRDKFAEYRRTFLEKHPGYYRAYADKKRGEKYEGGLQRPHGKQFEIISKRTEGQHMENPKIINLNQNPKKSKKRNFT
jgi:hypothetical protein